jgi:hypothetical protein
MPLIPPGQGGGQPLEQRRTSGGKYQIEGNLPPEEPRDRWCSGGPAEETISPIPTSSGVPKNLRFWNCCFPDRWSCTRCEDELNVRLLSSCYQEVSSQRRLT